MAEPSKSDNRALLLAAAARLFARRGFDGTSLQTIADEVGITKQTLLYHYPSKQALRLAVIEQLFGHWRALLPQMLEAVTSGYDRFDLLTQELVRFFQEEPDRALLVMRELMDRPSDMRKQIAANMRPWILVVAQYIQHGKDIGQLHADVDAESYILHVVTLAIAAVANLGMVTAALSPHGEDVDPDAGAVEGVAVQHSPGTAGAETRSIAAQRHVDELMRIARTSLFARPRSDDRHG